MQSSIDAVRRGYLSILHVAGKRAVDELAVRGVPRPVPEVAARGVGTLEDVAVLALEEAEAAMLYARNL